MAFTRGSLHFPLTAKATVFKATNPFIYTTAIHLLKHHPSISFPSFLFWLLLQSRHASSLCRHLKIIVSVLWSFKSWHTLYKFETHWMFFLLWWKIPQTDHMDQICKHVSWHYSKTGLPFHYIRMCVNLKINQKSITVIQKKTNREYEGIPYINSYSFGIKYWDKSYSKHYVELGTGNNGLQWQSVLYRNGKRMSLRH